MIDNHVKVNLCLQVYTIYSSDDNVCSHSRISLQPLFGMIARIDHVSSEQFDYTNFDSISIFVHFILKFFLTYS